MAAKGYDDSPPRNGVIFFYSVLTVVFLFGVQQMLDSYFAKMMDAEFQEKVYTRGLDTAVEAKAADQAALEKSGIEDAKRLYIARGRSASAVIQVESGSNKPAIGGWSQLKREAPVAPAAPAAVPVPSAAPAPVPEGAVGGTGGGVKAPAASGNTSPSAGAGVTTTNTSTGRVPAPGAAAPAADSASKPAPAPAGGAQPVTNPQQPAPKP